MTATAVLPDRAVLRARTAVVTAFTANGLAYGSFISRTPAIRADLHLSTAQLAILLLCLSVASVATLPAAGPIITRLGPSRGVLGGALTMTAGLVLLGLGVATGTVVLAGAGLALCGAGTGIWDVAMNVEGAAVERRLGRSIMPRLHGAFSIGTVAGAGIGAGSAALSVGLGAQVLVLAVLLPVVMVPATRNFLAKLPDDPEQPSAVAFRARDAWREPRTILLGLMVLGFAMTEGSANDWLAVSLVDGYHQTGTVGALAYACFTAAMTTGRFVGGSLIDRFGRVPALRGTALLALLGLGIVIAGTNTPFALLGAILWGLGASLGFPIGMSAGADDPARAAARVSVVSSIGYVAFLAGPPLIGPLAQHVGILHALFVVVGAIILGALASGSARQPGSR